MSVESGKEESARLCLEEHAQEVLAVLGETLGLEGMAFDSESKCVFALEDRFLFLAFFDSGRTNSIVLTVPLGFVPEEEPRRERLLAAMMSGNYGWGLTEGGTLGLDDGSGMLSLTYMVRLPMLAKAQIADIVARLVSAADYWMGQVEEANGEEGGERLPDGGRMLRI